MQPPLSLFEKIWNRHVIRGFSEGREPIRIGRHVRRETTTWWAFNSLCERGKIDHRPPDSRSNDLIAEGVC